MVISGVVVLRLEERYITCYLSNTTVEESYELCVAKVMVILYCNLLQTTLQSLCCTK